MKESPFTKRRGGSVLRTIGLFSLGAAVGSGVALLFAPASGRVTRRRIAQKLRYTQRVAAQKLGRAGKVIARQAVNLREAATERIYSAKDWVAGHVTNGHATRRSTRRAAHHA